MKWIQIFEKKNGRLPVRRDLGKLGSPSDYSIKKYFGSWTNALKMTMGTVHRKQYSKNECLNYLKKLGRYHTYDQLKILSREFGNPHPDTIIKLTGMRLPKLQESLGFGIKFGIFGAYPVFWEQLCERVALAIYGNIKRQYSVSISGKRRRLDIYVPKEKLIVKAMTSSYDTVFKRSALNAYVRKFNSVECWCVSKGKELSIDGVKYYYVDDMISWVKDTNLSTRHKIVLVKNLNAFKTRPDRFLEKLGMETRKQLVADLKSRAKELNRVPKQVDMKTSEGYATYQVYKRTFGSWKGALKAAGF